MNKLARFFLNLPPQASTSSSSIDYLHYFVVSITVFGAMAVFAVAFFFIVRYRRRSNAITLTPKVQGSKTIEAIVITTLLSLFLAIWVVGFAQYLSLRTPPPGALEVYVTGKQWMWEFAYPQGPGSKGVLYVPVNRPVKLLITSRDVLHSFFVPAFRMKQDAVPGRYTVAWFEANQVGSFPIFCAEYCGASHSGMLGDVVVLSEEDFEKWVSSPQGPIAEDRPLSPGGTPPIFDTQQRRGLASRGEKEAADAGCLRCHTLDGTPHLGPTYSGLFGRNVTLQDGTIVVADEAYLTESMMDPIAKIVRGFPPIMPSYRGRLTPVQVASIIEFIKTLTPTDKRATQPDPLPLNAQPTRAP